MIRNDNMNTVSFDSITELAAWADKEIDESRRYRRDSGSWYGRTDWATTTARCAMGYDANVEEARKLLTKLESSINVSTTVWESQVSGCFPIVPEYLAGEPECMYEQTPSTADTAPLSIYIDLTTSYSIEADEYRKRGLAVLALTMLLSAVRPVNLHLITVMGGKAAKGADGEQFSIVSARVETAPLDLTRAAYALTDVSVPRHLFYATAEKLHKFAGEWPTFKGSNYGKVTSEGYVNRVKELIGQGDEVLYIPAVCVIDSQADAMINRPVEWLNKKLTEFGGVQQ